MKLLLLETYTDEKTGKTKTIVTVILCLSINLINSDITVSGYGQERGGIVTKIHNQYWNPITIIFLENIPWFMPIYFHTLLIKCNGKEIKPCKCFNIFIIKLHA